MLLQKFKITITSKLSFTEEEYTKLNKAKIAVYYTDSLFWECFKVDFSSYFKLVKQCKECFTITTYKLQPLVKLLVIS